LTGDEIQTAGQCKLLLFSKEYLKAFLSVAVYICLPF
jgi:hypothetical protein